MGYEADCTSTSFTHRRRRRRCTGLPTNREAAETADYIGEKESRGLHLATLWRNQPFLCVPNGRVQDE
jgi:hypothetical protein